ncbi:low-density lipoprotein receptor domain class A domain-containing protein [Phthorimaea operculella]|nr:low-density lipoprotein receptor domain class A domain-containing protein [Phthorimaea operculella]
MFFQPRREWWCDGEADCGDGSDEANCTSTIQPSTTVDNGTLQCGTRLQCTARDRIWCQPEAWRCDGRADCARGYDEDPTICAKRICTPPMFYCGGHQCIPQNLMCDGFDDCQEGLDERTTLCLRFASDGVCFTDEQLCDDGRCVPIHATCEQGDKAKVVVAESGSLRLWELHKHEHDNQQGIGNTQKPDISTIAVALIDQSWWVWWGDENGSIRRLDISSFVHNSSGPLVLSMTHSEPIVKDGGVIRGVAIDWVSKRIYWTTVQVATRETTGAVYCAALDGRRRRALYTRRYGEPDDILLYNMTRQMVWSERGSDPGIMIAGMDGSDPRWLVRRRVRRVTALAIHTPGNRLYFVDAYYDTLESVKFDGSDRVVVAIFNHGSGEPPKRPHIILDPKDNSTKPLSVPSRSCLRMAVWEEWIWCATRRGLARIPRRIMREPMTPRPQFALSALAVVHPALFLAPPQGIMDPCKLSNGSSSCHSSALCVRAPGEPGFACLCPDGLTPKGEVPDARRECVILSNTTPSVKNCSLECGQGTCVLGADGGQSCHCKPLFDGPRCQHYRCAQHCHHHGHCMLADDQKSLKCICPAGYYGPRCEMPVANRPDPCLRVRCENGGTCRPTRFEARCLCQPGYHEWCQPPGPVPSSALRERRHMQTHQNGANRPDPCLRVRCENGGTCRPTRFEARCLCQPGYHGIFCEQCDDAPDCAAGSFCVRTDAGTECRADICRDMCLNQGTCSVSSDGRVTCACPPQWSGEQCQRPACVDSDCATNDSLSHDHNHNSNALRE